MKIWAMVYDDFGVISDILGESPKLYSTKEHMIDDIAKLINSEGIYGDLEMDVECDKDDFVRVWIGEDDLKLITVYCYLREVDG